VIADNLKTHKSVMVREWLEGHPRIEHAFIPKGAAWLNLIEAWWRLFPQTGTSRGGLRRQLRDRSADEGRHPAVEPQSEAVGMGTTSQTAQASEASFYVPSLRNGALEDNWSLAWSLLTLGGVSGYREEYERAMEFYQEGLALCLELGSPTMLAEYLISLGYEYLFQGDYE
jgi:hypothetical protein